MNFEKVEVYGFKSFADKSEIKFGNGITGIVGPNGCGKSNVADAIRWVLGEQSAKTLRGTSMQDVIFSGTQNRKSLSYCEVSLFFDNSTKMFSLDYNEVIITRKLFRSGESEYYINKQPARLKDIVDLLRECGIGKNGYTIIGQGKVEEIMSAKPEDRRAVFEDATGISKFKQRKVETERKLERTKENRLRFLDIITEIENQLAPLEKQAEKAKQYYELSDELKHHEINVYIAKLDNVGERKEKINKRIDGLNEAINLKQQGLTDAQKAYENILDEINTSDSKLNALQSELLEKRVGLEKQHGEIQLFKEKIGYLEEQLNNGKNRIENNKQIIEELTDKKEQFKVNVDLKEKEKENLEREYDSVSKELLKISSEISLGEEIANENTQKIIKSLESLSDINVNKGTLSVEKNNLLARRNEITEGLGVLYAKRDKLFGEKEGLDKKITDLDLLIYDQRGRIADKEDEIRNANEEISKVENEIYNLNSNITMLTTRANFFKGLKESYEGFMPAVRKLLQHAKENRGLKAKIQGVVAEIIKNDSKYDIALETALGQALQNIVTENTDDAKFLINYLKQNEIGRLTFLPITSIKPRINSDAIIRASKEIGALGLATDIVSYDDKYENVISNLLGNTLICDNIVNATNIANKYRFAFKIVTLDGDVLSTQGAMTGGFKKQSVDGLLSNDRKLEEIAEKLIVKQKDMEKAKETKVSLEERRDKATDELSFLNEMYQSKREEFALLREKLSVTENALIEINKEVESDNDFIEIIDKKIEKLDKDYEAIKSGSAKLEEDKNLATISANKKQEEFEDLKAKRDSLSVESTQLQVKITSLKSEISQIESEIFRLGGEISDLEKTNKDIESNNENLSVALENFRLESEKVTFTKEEQEKVNALRDKITSMQNRREELKADLSKKDVERQSLTDEITLLTDKKHQEGLLLTKIDADIEYAEQNIWEDYELNYEMALEFKEEGYDLKTGEQEVNRIRKKRSSLGEINANAIEDSKALRERYEEYKTQENDLREAEDDLKEALATIKAEMLEQFNEGFEKINENFSRIFKELFGGGRAMLELDYTDTDDKLEAGIEIIAEPPGKKLQKLSLLSGGEKALTAIAILFAILKLRPMPFCVLDEIEAALDEANVDRFAKYLKKFSEETQFIVITHRKPTMVMADALFGVTMQEKGVSKLVSVKLADIVEEEA
ncbi:MAG: chromosome segregation protein SMC [Clostridiales bacterium]|nr:chromosome segregation protein SMC [Clostridiales bacterium]